MWTLVFALLLIIAACSSDTTGSTTTVAPTSTTSSTSSTTSTVSSTLTPTTTTTLLVRDGGTIPGWTVGEPWGSVAGVTMFRGNPTRTYYGSGIPPDEPAEAWRYPDSAMCRESVNSGEVAVWCGLGWTGQPVVWERSDGVAVVIFGAYDGAVHFVDGRDGSPMLEPFQTGDIIKGSVTLDPDGFPLVYFGSRDNFFRIVSFDTGAIVELWSLHSGEVRGIWNNDWDSNAVIVDDVLYLGGENGWFFAYQLNRSYAQSGLVSVDPEQLLAMAGYDEELLASSGRNVSIESSPVLFEERVYFTNSGGRVVGLDVSNIRDGTAPIVFDYYSGGDIDASPVVDGEGSLYVAIEHEPAQMGPVELTRNLDVGQLIKLNPYAEGDPRVWGIDLTDGSSDSGIWATPALYRGHLYVSTQTGELLVVDTATGEIVWTDDVGWHAWSSPVVVDDVLVVATCLGGELRAYSVEVPASPSPLWSVSVAQNCVEATPTIWNGTIYIGARDGYMRAFR